MRTFILFGRKNDTGFSLGFGWFPNMPMVLVKCLIMDNELAPMLQIINIQILRFVIALSFTYTTGGYLQQVVDRYTCWRCKVSRKTT